MKRLHQGHLHPRLKVLRLTCPAGKRTRASTVGGEHLYMAAPVHVALHMDLNWDVGRIAFASDAP